MTSRDTALEVATPHVVHLSTVHRPFDVRIFHKECRTLADAGYRVTFVVPHDHDEVRDGVQIRALRRPRGRVDRMTALTIEAFRSALALRADAYHIHDPELIPAGVLLRFLGHAVVFDVHEDLRRQILQKTWLRPWQRRIASWMAVALDVVAGRAGNVVVTATSSIARNFPADKVVTVQNFPLRSELPAVAGTEYQSRAIPVAYVGGARVPRGLFEMIDAMALVPAALNARLTIAGDVAPQSALRRCEERGGWVQTDYLGWLDRTAVVDLLGKAKVGLVLFHPLPNHVEAQPNKLFEYMSGGMAIVASDFPLWRTLIENVGCGLVVDPMQPAAIAEAIAWLLEHPEEAAEMGRRGQQAVRERYNWEAEAPALLGVYASLLGSRSVAGVSAVEA
jgi:glycosyltransferase involved in cell wall biosynthesis